MHRRHECTVGTWVGATVGGGGGGGGGARTRPSHGEVADARDPAQGGHERLAREVHHRDGPRRGLEGPDADLCEPFRFEF